MKTRLPAFTLLEMMLVLALSGIVILLGYQLFNWTSRLESNHIRQEQSHAQLLSFINRLEQVSTKSSSVHSNALGEVRFNLTNTSYTLTTNDSVLVLSNGIFVDTIPGILEAIELLDNPKQLVKNIDLNIFFNNSWQGYRIEKHYTTEELIRYEDPIE